MTPKETAKWIMDQWENNELWSVDVSQLIEQAIIAAVEEEREACAKIAQDHIPGLLEYDSIDDGGAYKRVTAASIRDKIRNRRNKPDGGTK